MECTSFHCKIFIIDFYHTVVSSFHFNATVVVLLHSAGTAAGTYKEDSWGRSTDGFSKTAHVTSWCSAEPVKFYMRSADVGKVIGRHILLGVYVLI